MYVNDLFQFGAVTIHSISDSLPCRLEKLCAGIHCSVTKAGETVYREKKKTCKAQSSLKFTKKYSHQVHDNKATLTGICFVLNCYLVIVVIKFVEI